MEDKKRFRYINKKGKEVEIRYSKHALYRFKLRSFIIGLDSIHDDIIMDFCQCFNESRRIINLSVHQKKRSKKHGKHTLYFENEGLIFIVKDRAIVTVEIDQNHSSFLNKIKNAKDVLKKSPLFAWRGTIEEDKK